MRADLVGVLAGHRRLAEGAGVGEDGLLGVADLRRAEVADLGVDAGALLAGGGLFAPSEEGLDDLGVLAERLPYLVERQLRDLVFRIEGEEGRVHLLGTALVLDDRVEDP